MSEAVPKSKTPTYVAWASMKARCYTPSSTNYRHYGERGIRVCDRWRESYEAFLSDVGERPSPDHSLGRIDNDGNYEPGNVRWETISQQHRNCTRNTVIEHDGKALCVIEWAEHFGVEPGVLWRRLARGWTLERAASEPVRQLNRVRADGIEFDGRRQTIAAWARETGIPMPTLWRRLKAGWPTEKALREPVAPRGLRARLEKGPLA